jgi:hypothetical protein
MPFDANAALEYVNDPRYDILKKPIKIDKDSKAYEIQLIPPATAKGTYSKTDVIDMGSVPCFNSDGTNHYIDVYTGSDYKVNLQGCAIIMKYHCRQVRKPAGSAYVGVPIAPTNETGTGVGSSIPWNPLYFFNTVSLKANQSQTPIEQYINAGQFSHITTSRLLKKYKSQALEANDMSFMTPCIEEKFDNDTMSIASAQRSTLWTGASGAYDAASSAGTTTDVYYQKVIPLADFFECCEAPAVWSNINRFRIEFTMKLPDQIAFMCPRATVQAGASKVYVYVDEIKLLFDSCRMQPKQTLDVASEKQKGFVENVGFLNNFCVPIPYTAGNQIVVTGQKNAQEFILGFPAEGVTLQGSACSNPIQYHTGSLSSLSLMYGADLPFRTPIPLSGDTTSLLNSIAYDLYRKSCGADRANLVPLAISFSKYRFYHFYFLPIFYQATSHLNSDPKDCRIDSTGGVSGNAVAIIRKLALTQIASDGNVDVMA